ncbi:MAG: class I SAM-dependent methyltransferase [Planctomycetes bacterium]|nr:class I SAM-dependent methyltransferase [Planctomycetota bacterium]
MTLAHAGRMPASSMDVPFDYSGVIFGNEGIIDIGAHNWGAVRMGRCLESLIDVRGRVLEIGCGAGRCIRTIRHHRPDLEAWACDLSKPAIGTARAHGDGVRYAVSNAEGLPYPTGAFDAVVIMDLLEHVPDVSAVLAEVRRVCKPGAIMHLHVPCEGAPLSLYRPLIAAGCDLTRRAVGHVHHFRRGDVLRHLREAGFTITRTRHSMYWFHQIHDMIGWISRLSGQGCPSGPATPTRTGCAPGESDRSTPSSALRIKHLISKPAWWLIHALLPKLQYIELRALAWQPLGAIGFCVTARRT